MLRKIPWTIFTFLFYYGDEDKMTDRALHYYFWINPDVSETVRWNSKRNYRYNPPAHKGYRPQHYLMQTCGNRFVGKFHDKFLRKNLDAPCSIRFATQFYNPSLDNVRVCFLYEQQVTDRLSIGFKRFLCMY